MHVLRDPKLHQKMTVDEFWDFCQLPENQDRRFELVKGVVIEMSRPTRRHGVVMCNLARILSNFTYEIGSGYIITNDSFALGKEPHTVIGPDVAFYTNANTFDEIHPKWGEELPVLAVDVLSPNDKISQVFARVRDYLVNGVRVVWLVDYEERSISVYRPNRTLEVYNDTHTLTGGEELPGFSCPIAELFRIPGEPTTPTPAAPDAPPAN